jgi:hypothetical protein
MQEKENRRRAEQEEERNYAQQTTELTKMRGHLEFDFLQKKKDKETNMINENLRKMEEAKELERQREAEKKELERQRVAMLNERGQKQTYRPF